ncbi:MBL fold metallo-hydrolase [Helicobacter turcicus]|uniref:MBL fold metallo-hydrolase n=1 Tax=Helicobacter turcicus TaxID=2867412 RepID=A0ABS7JPZ5_9HELI|nr:MBL fold metallo-hydrolase [Helicobacter turcicus]MBX7491438.1 MBL fold metallo-hydrolase [Helicobacter turcicus]MBX7545898.1 MBL fold metallo-hydrolase [Helicobacter turcicus]
MQVFDNDFFYVLCKPFGEYQTNCYLVFDKTKKEALIIDPGIGASSWVIDTLKSTNTIPLAILNTHGHFDHVWSNAELLKYFAEIPLLCPYEDAFMLAQDCFSTGLPNSIPTLLIGAKENDKICEKTSNTSNLERKNDFTYGNFAITFICYPGHTPGCSVVVICHKDSSSLESQEDLQSLSSGNKVMFSGDFIFHRSIGRSDFPYSSHTTMKASLEKFLTLQEDMLILPGHGSPTSVAQEQSNIPFWLPRL